MTGGAGRGFKNNVIASTSLRTTKALRVGYGPGNRALKDPVIAGSASRMRSALSMHPALRAAISRRMRIARGSPRGDATAYERWSTGIFDVSRLPRYTTIVTSIPQRRDSLRSQ